jgi:hypothetical protein
MQSPIASFGTRLFSKVFLALTVGSGLWIFLQSEEARAAGSPTNTLNFSETYNEKIACTNASGTPICAKVRTDQFAVTAKLLLSHVDVTTFSYDTIFSFNLGDVRLTNQLGSDLNYFPGKRSFKYLIVARDSAGKTLISYLINLKWTTNTLKITITGRTTDVTNPYWDSVLANGFAGNPSGLVETTANGVVALGGYAVQFSAVPVSGHVVTKEKTGRDGSPFTTSKVAVKGKGLGS